jgi:hypothetical protein
MFDGYPFASDIGNLVAQLSLAGYWRETLLEYGVNSVGAGVPIIVSDPAPASIGGAAVQQWLASKFDSDPQHFGVPSSSTVYSIFYPQSTTLLGAIACGTGFFGYHTNFAVGSTQVTYVVVPQCGDEDSVTQAATRYWLDAITDPFPQTNPDYVGVADDQFAWDVAGYHGIGGMCATWNDPQTFAPPTVLHALSFGWSNQAAQQGHNPCVPQATGTVYFNAAPVLTDSIAVAMSGTSLQSKGVHIPAGQSKTIDIDLFSDGPTSGAWSVDAVEFTTGASPSLDLTLDKASGQNGDVLHLTIAVAPNPSQSWQAFVVRSTFGTTTNGWPGLVGND